MWVGRRFGCDTGTFWDGNGKMGFSIDKSIQV